MKKLPKIFKLVTAFALLALTFIACDKDFSSLESDIQGIKNFNDITEKYPVIAYNKATNPVQTDNLSSNLLGVFNDPIYGITEASVVTQLVPEATYYGHDFGTNPEIVSVTLKVPFYSSVIDTDEEGNSAYELDSIFGNITNPIELSVYRTNYFLTDYDPNADFSENQIYYSNAHETINFDNHLLELLYYEDVYVPYTFGTYLTEAPGLSLNLIETEDANGFWENMFFNNQDSPELSNSNNFKNFFRGLYFKAVPVSNNGHLIMLDFSERSAGITIEYTNDDTEEDETLEYKLTFANVNRLNTLKNDAGNTVIADASNNADMINGDHTLYLKGGEGAYSVIELFGGEDTDGNGQSDNYENFISAFIDSNGNSKRLVNEASLSFYVNQDIVNGQEPDRVTLYDLKNKMPIVDYYYDPIVSTTSPLHSKNYFSKVLERDENNNGIKYKINVTEHINNLLLRDSTNVKLGLYITTNINTLVNSDVLNDDETTIPATTVLSPRGTAIYGSNNTVPEEKRLQLEINYTEPD